ncbi:Yip1 family protein [Ectobacillus panaciterrae]|uniref:Yip1 family protein n=1 Tax=Ectobacillus panaciterrae TaxID=363872 RepID=UPI000428139D|nr:Yip1 family protein [Ectobacillus panaciterrae]
METNVEMQRETAKPSLFGMLTSPGVQFERMRGKTPIAVPMIILIIIQAIMGAAVTYLTIREQAPADVQVPLWVSTAFGVVAVVVGVIIAYFVIAALYKILAMILGSDITYSKLLAITVYTSVISVVGGIANTILMAVLGGTELKYTSLAPLFEKGTVLSSIASSFDIFAIWAYIAMALGLQIAGGFTKNKSIVFVVIVFVVTAAAAAGFTHLGSWLASLAPGA